MALAKEDNRISGEDYLQGELASEIRHEYVAGNVYAMSGGTLNQGDALFTESPSVILEVLSPTTRRNDEVQKFRDYLTIPTLGTYILAETESPFLTLHRRDGAGFRRETLSGPDAILDLPEAGISIHLAELYRDVD